MPTCNKSIHLIGNRANTRIKPSGSININSGDYAINFYRLIWDSANVQGGADVFNMTNEMNFHNVVFTNLGNYSYGYFVSGTNANNGKRMFNCVLTSSPSQFFENHQADKWVITNSYGGFTSGYGTSQSQWDYQTNYVTSSPNLDTSYHILDSESLWKNQGTGTNLDGTQANIGVYGGPYDWTYTDNIFN